MRCALAH